MDLELIFLQMGKLISVSFKMVSLMDRELIIGQMDSFIKETTFKGNDKEKEHGKRTESS